MQVRSRAHLRARHDRPMRHIREVQSQAAPCSVSISIDKVSIQFTKLVPKLPKLREQQGGATAGLRQALRFISMVGCNCAGTVHGVNGGTDQRVTCSIANCSAENHISAEAARRAGFDLVALEQQAGLTDILGNTTSADSLARNVRISLLDADGQWVEFVLPTVIVLQTPMNPNCQFTLGQPFFKYRGLSLTAQGMGTRREWNDPDMVWFPEDPQLQEDPNVAYLGISQWQEGTRPKTCTVCGLEFPGLKACGRCVAEATPRAQRPRYCSRDCQRQHWRAEHRAFHQERNMTIAAALGRGGLPADAQGEVRGF